ncbi:MAG: glycosyltransferase family 4 protein [Pseudomonadota bacterium]
MRIVYVTSSFPYGLGEEFIAPEVQSLAARGHEVLIVPMWPRGHQTWELGERIRACEMPLASIAVLRGATSQMLRTPKICFRAISLALVTRPNVLTKNLAVVMKGLWLSGVARIWSADHIHAHWAATTATMAMIASEASGIDWSFTAHRWDIVENNLLARKCQHASFARFISQSAIRLAESHGVRPDRTRILHMGVVLPDRKISWNSGEAITLLCPANLVSIKGHHYLVDAMRELRNRRAPVQLLLAGDGSLRHSLEQRVVQLELEQSIHFLGQLKHDKLLAMYARSEVDVVVLPSVNLGRGQHEGIPVSLMEAMAFGIPVISTLTGGIPELLHDGAGLLIPERDHLALAAAIELLSSQPDLRARIGADGQTRVKENFTIEHVVEKLEAWFCEGSGNAA